MITRQNRLPHLLMSKTKLKAMRIPLSCFFIGLDDENITTTLTFDLLSPQLFVFCSVFLPLLHNISGFVVDTSSVGVGQHRMNQ